MNGGQVKCAFCRSHGRGAALPGTRGMGVHMVEIAAATRYYSCDVGPAGLSPLQPTFGAHQRPPVNVASARQDGARLR